MWIGPCAVSRQRGCSPVSRRLQIRPRNTAADGPWLHWLRVPERVKFKLCVLMHRCLTGAAPRYLTELAVPVASTARRRLRSVSSADLVVPSTRRSTIGDRAFAVVSPRAWNAYHLTSEHLHHHSTRLRNIWNLTSFNCLSLASRACDYVYIDYVRRSKSSSYRLLRPINCQTYITLHYMNRQQ